MATNIKYAALRIAKLEWDKRMLEMRAWCPFCGEDLGDDEPGITWCETCHNTVRIVVEP
jgi:hypothetical protein